MRNSLGSGKRLEACAFFLVVLLTYFPAVHGYYLHTEDYFWSSWGDLSCSEMIHFNANVGRPVLGMLFCPAKLVHAVEWMNAFRFLCVANISLIGYLTMRWLRAHGVDRIFSFLLGLTFVTLPSFVVYAGYLVAGCLSLSITAAFGALGLVYRSAQGRPVFGRKWDWVAAVVLLIVSLCIYQPGALVFVAFFTVPLVLEKEAFLKKRWRFAATGAGLLALAIIIYYFAWSQALDFFAVNSLDKYDARELVSDPFGRAIWFWQGPLFETANLWNLFPNGFVPSVVTALGLAAFFGERYCLPARSAILWRVGSFLALLLLLPASFAVHLVSSQPSTDYRGYPALYAVLFLGVLLSLYPWIAHGRARRWAIGACSLLALFGCAEANSTLVRFFIVPDSSELAFVMDEIARQGEKLALPGSSIHVSQTHTFTRILPKRNEIGEITMSHAPNARPMIRAALRELQADREVPVTLEAPDQSDQWYEYDGFDGMKGLNRHWVGKDPTRTVFIDMGLWRS